MEEKKTSTGKWVFVAVILALLLAVSFMIASALSFFFTGDSLARMERGSGNVALIRVSGTIIPEREDLLFSSGGADAKTIIRQLEKAEASPTIKAILLEINSPGGTGVASAEIAEAVKSSQKLTVAWIREVGASGAYWVASAADHIVAHPLSVTGSIGVLGSYVTFTGLMQEHGVYYQRFVGGEYKDIGTPFRNMTSDENALYQSHLDEIHEYFIFAVADNRNLPKSKVRELATGMFYTGQQARKLGLVDELGGRKEALQIIESSLNITAVPVDYKEKRTLSDFLSELSMRQSFYTGLAQSMFTEVNHPRAILK